MRLEHDSCNYQPHFKQVNIIKVSKKAFANPDKWVECMETFDKALGKLVNEKELSSLQKTLAAEGVNVPIKFLTILESPGFLSIKKFLDRKGKKSLEWLKQVTGLNVKMPLSEDCHSFYVLTKNNIYYYFKNLGLKGELDCMKKALDATRDCVGESGLAKAYAMMSEFMDEKFTKLLDNEPVKEFKIQSLDELGKFVNDLDIEKF